MCSWKFKCVIIYLSIINLVNDTMFFWPNSEDDKKSQAKPEGYGQKITVDEMFEMYSIREIVQGLLMQKLRCFYGYHLSRLLFSNML